MRMGCWLGDLEDLKISLASKSPLPESATCTPHLRQTERQRGRETERRRDRERQREAKRE
jgi:hypothetical protein